MNRTVPYAYYLCEVCRNIGKRRWKKPRRRELGYGRGKREPVEPTEMQVQTMLRGNQHRMLSATRPSSSVAGAVHGKTMSQQSREEGGCFKLRGMLKTSRDWNVRLYGARQMHI